MIGEPEIALAASPRDWAQRLHRHLADHGGARVRATVLHPHDALAERYHVLVVDDTTSFLSHRLIGGLHRANRRVVGVYDPDDPGGKGELLELGVDAVVAATADTAEFLEAIAGLTAGADTADAPLAAEADAARASRAGAGPVAAGAGPLAAGAGPLAAGAGVAERHPLVPGPGRPTEPSPTPGGHITVVGGPPGGCGATELAVALAAAVGHRGEPCVLVDADEVAPSLAPRLGLRTYPNVRAAIDAVEQLAGDLASALTPVEAGRFWALPGLARPTDWSQVRPVEMVELARALARPGVHVIADVASRLEDLGGGGPARYGSTRALVGAADTLVAVTTATPVGVGRLLDWAADARLLAPALPLHVVVNRTPASRFARAEVAAELERTLDLASLTFAPADPRVEAAAWSATVVVAGPFTRAVGGLAAAALPSLRSSPRRRWGRRRRAAGVGS